MRGMARAHRLTKVLAHLLPVQRQRGWQLAFELLMYRAVPSQRPTVQQAERRHAPALHGIQALGNGEYRGVQTQTCVPKQADEFGQHLLERVRLLSRIEKEHDVQFGVGKGVAAPVGAAGQHRHRVREGRFHHRPVRLDHRLVAGQRQRHLHHGRLARGQEFFFDRAPLRGGLQILRTLGRGAGPAIRKLRHASSITQRLRNPARGSSYGANRNYLS